MARSTRIVPVLDPQIQQCGVSDLWSASWTAITSGRTPSTILLQYMRREPARRSTHAGPEAALRAQVDHLQDQLITVNREVRELRSQLRKFSSGPQIIFEELDLPEFPNSQVEPVAAEMLRYLGEHGKTDVFEFAEAKDLDFRLVAQAVRLLEKQGRVAGG